MDSLTDRTREISSLGQTNINAILRSGEVWASGMQTISQLAAEAFKTQVNYTISTWRTLTEISLKATEQAVDPLMQRLNGSSSENRNI